MKIAGYSRAMDQYVGPGAGRSAIDFSPLLGTWINFDKATRGTARVILSRQDNALRIHAFGACSPELCDWGTVPASGFADSVSNNLAVGFCAVYHFGFLETMLAGYLNKRLLVVDSYNQFRDGSGRSQYFLRDHFYQEAS